MASSSRKLNNLEISIHKLISSCSDHIATQADIERIEATRDERQNAINHLLSAGMIKLMKGEGKTFFYRAVKVQVAKSKGTLDKDTLTILEHIESAGNDGIWTKAIQRRTDLPQKVVARSIKTLEQQNIIKPIKSVKYPTRKMYMMFNLTPSVEVTGGVWYTAQEFDTEFVNVLLDHIYNYIAKHTLPPSLGKSSRRLYPPSEPPRYPNLARICDWVEKSGVAEEKLKEDDIEMLLRVLEFDGRIERIPATSSIHIPMSMSSDEEDAEVDDAKSAKSSTKGSSKRKRNQASSDEEMVDRKDGKKRRRPDESEDEANEMSSRKKEGKGHLQDSDEESDEDQIIATSKGKQNKKRLKKEDPPKKKKTKDSARNRFDPEQYDDEKLREGYEEMSLNEAFVYRVVYPSTRNQASADHEGETGVSSSIFSSSLFDTGGSIFNGTWLGGEGHLPWAEAPCVRCPQADFCQEKGPVNASGCGYYDEWLDPERATNRLLKMDDEDEGAKMAIEMES